ncbi:hypothetical protein IWX50DRAFT_347382 [Phyllosticta citricarpa]|uniref:Uncharacterized protein n=1 Tax=Phyllosticta citricarpa TaxID=55181 RepID=A0ABR1M873_9PEZI
MYACMYRRISPRKRTDRTLLLQHDAFANGCVCVASGGVDNWVGRCLSVPFSAQAAGTWLTAWVGFIWVAAFRLALAMGWEEMECALGYWCEQRRKTGVCWIRVMYSTGILCLDETDGRIRHLPVSALLLPLPQLFTSLLYRLNSSTCLLACSIVSHMLPSCHHHHHHHCHRVIILSIHYIHSLTITPGG